jgi:hypothetical protein
MSFRFFDPATREWSIYWADSRRPGLLDLARDRLVRRRHGRLRGRRHVQGKPIRVRFTWSRVTTDSPRWEQAFSDDDGETWETNWGQRLHADRRRHMSVRPRRLPAPDQGDRTRRRRSPSASARSSGTTSRRRTSPSRAGSGRWRARRFAERSTRARSLSTDDLGFVILHRCGESFYFLIVATWRNDNELWETVWAKNGESEVPSAVAARGTHRPTFCVWELGAVWHEQQAWSRFLRSSRGAAARECLPARHVRRSGLSPLQKPGHAARRTGRRSRPAASSTAIAAAPRRRGSHSPPLRGEALDRVQARVPRPTATSAFCSRAATRSCSSSTR